MATIAAHGGVSEAVGEDRPLGEAPRFLRRLMRRKLAVACVAYLAMLVVIGIVAPLVMPWVAGQHAGDFTAIGQGPSSRHPLGTDLLGRDVLERLLVGTRITIEGVGEALVVVLALGVPLGLLAGYFGGWLDACVGWLADVTFSVPAIVVIIVVLSVFPQSMLAAMCTLGVIAAPGLMRVVRSATLPVRQELYIDAARVSGLSHPYIVTRHVLPRIAGPVIVQASLLAAVALLIQTGLGYLGLVVSAPAPSWGGMIGDGVTALVQHSWLIWPPGLLVAISILAFGLLGDAVRDASTEQWSSGAGAGTRRRRGSRRIARANPRRAGAPPVASPGVAVGREPTPDASGVAQQALLRIEDLSVALRSQGGTLTSVLEGVTFDVRPGETVGLVGESGCGKTMTAMGVLGLLPPGAVVVSGCVRFGARNLTSLAEPELRRIRGKEIALISQEPMISLDPSFRVGTQLAEAVRRHHGLDRRSARQRMLELLRDVQLPDPALVARRYPHELSGGMAQRVAIARALAGGPRLLIADEPTTALDVTVQAEVLHLLRELQREHGMAILLVTHDLGVVADMCERAVVMYAGQVVERADLISLFRAPRHPYTAALLASNPQSAPAGSLPTIPGTVPQPGGWPAGCHFAPRCSYAIDACTRQAVPLTELGAGRQTRCIRHEELAEQ